MKIVIIENLININTGNEYYYPDNYCLENAEFNQSFHPQNGRRINDGKKQEDVADEVSSHQQAQEKHGKNRAEINRIFRLERQFLKPQN